MSWVRLVFLAFAHMITRKCVPLELLHHDGSVSRVCSICGSWKKG